MFIGQKEVDRIDGNKVYFKDGALKEYTEKQLAYLVTETEKDLSEVNAIVIENVMPLIQAILDEGLEELETAGKVLSIFEEHDLTKAEIIRLVHLINNNLIDRHNAFLRETVGKEIEEFAIKKEKYAEISRILSDSYNRVLFTSIGRALGTYNDDDTPEDYYDNVRMSHIKQFI